MSSSGNRFLRSKKTKPSPRPQPFDDASEEDEIPPQYEPHHEDTEESSDEENAEEYQDPVTKPEQDPQTPAAALTVATPALDGVRQLALGTPSGAVFVAPSSNRIWQEPMQLLLLTEMVEYSENNGKCKVKGKMKGNSLNLELLKLSRKLWGEPEKCQVKKRKRTKIEVVDNGGDDDGGTAWENAMVRLMKEKFYYESDYTKQKITSMNDSTRDLLKTKWLKRKRNLNTAIIDFDRVENVCLKSLLPS